MRTDSETIDEPKGDEAPHRRTSHRSLELQTQRMLEIARDLASRHALEANREPPAELPTAKLFLRALEQTLATDEKLILEVLSAREAGDLRRRMCEFPEHHPERFDDRIRRGRFLARPVRNFRIGIDASMRSDGTAPVDVAWDLAAITTELEALERTDLSETLISEYARASDDYDLYAVIDFYESLYAFESAMRALARPADRALTHTASEALKREARKKLLIALAAERGALVMPQVIAMSGRVASGKSTLGRHIGDAISAPVVVADRVRVALLEAPIDEDIPEAVWKQNGGVDLYESVYAELFRRAEVVLASGRPVVIDACFPTREMRERALRLAADYGAPFLFVECRASKALVRERLLERAVRDGVEASVWFDIASNYDSHVEEPDELEREEKLVLDTALRVEENAAILHPIIVAGHQVPVPGSNANREEAP
jgi:predicted kinase